MLAREIGHVVTLTHGSTETFAFGMNFNGGYLDRLQDIADKGGYITEGTTEARQLARDAAELRTIADELMKRRAALLANQSRMMRAAE